MSDKNNQYSEPQDFPVRKSTRLEGHDYSLHKFYFLTICTHQKHRLFEENQNCKVLLDAMNKYSEMYDVYLAAWCIMPDHIHIVCSPKGKKTISDFVRAIKSTSSRAFESDSRPYWQRSFFNHIIRSDSSLREKIAYTLLNPVRAGLGPQPRDYPWSWDDRGMKNQTYNLDIIDHEM